MRVNSNFVILLAPVVLSTSLRIISRGMSMSGTGHYLVLDSFAARQFNNPDYTGTKIVYSEVRFEKLVNQAYIDGATLVDGYAPFW